MMNTAAFELTMFIRRAIRFECLNLWKHGVKAHCASNVWAFLMSAILTLPTARMSTVQIPSAIPVAAVAINRGVNAALLSAQIIAAALQILLAK